MQAKRYAVENGAMTQVPCWEAHSRGKNWAAVIEADPTAPGGLKRTFLQKAHGDYYYLVAALVPGQTIEFGADYYSSSGRKNAKRVYGVVTAVAPDYVEIAQFGTSREALQAAKDMAPVATSRREELEAEIAALRERLAALEAELAALE